MGELLNHNKLLEKTYYDAENPGSYGGVRRLAEAVGLPTKDVRQWLMTQDTYTLHKPVRFKFKRRKVLSFGIGELMQCDLIDVSKLSKYNKGFKYILTAIDVFSKYAYAIPLKKKNADSMVEGLKKLFKQSKFALNLQTDEGKEFYNKKVQDLFKRHKIHHYSTLSEHKASVVERFNRTLKARLYRIFTHTNSFKYVDILKSVLKSYNKSKHRSTGYAPIEVTPELESVIFEKLYGYEARSAYKFKIDDQVRISKAKRTFRKGYLPNWTDEVFLVYKRFPSNPPIYILKDLKGTIIKGRFYEEELQKVSKSARDFWKIKKILKSRLDSRGFKEYLVSWRGFDERFNSWVKSSWMK